MINGVRDVTCVNVQLMYLAGPREVCVYYVFERGMDRGADGGRGRDSTRNESGLERERRI